MAARAGNWSYFEKAEQREEEDTSSVAPPLLPVPILLIVSQIIFCEMEGGGVGSKVSLSSAFLAVDWAASD